MSEKETIVFCVHGANQADKDPAKDYATWSDAFELEDACLELKNVILGNENDEIKNYHLEKHNNCDFPQYNGWASAWYGGIWQSLLDKPESERFSTRLSPSKDGEKDERVFLLEKIERGAMKKHFDELVPFYELAVIKDSNKTLYEEICSKVVDDLWEATEEGVKDFVMVGHSMGCCVCYNVLSHMTRVVDGQPPAAIEGALSPEYTEKIKKMTESSSKPFGLITFGNYMGYNWAQKANTRILYGERSRHYVYPDYSPRWFNFFTLFGGDPYIIDDLLESSIIGDDIDAYDDVSVWRVPFTNIGHGRHQWFRRDSFTNKMRSKLKKHLYR
ncbi:hypothetical protein [Desulfogranum marinum]|uniref:hypothetical protein n=1 Tax=Desulfogranum marinum TaxID=453220 RepID=UPI0029C9AE92|nr:hypothetical protein [Desulfogranum marinum]